MNFKVQLATFAAIILTIFLIAITAIKFDWMGSISRGEKIINFSSEEKVKVDDDKSEQKVPNKTEEDEPSMLMIHCQREKIENNVLTRDDFQASFLNQQLSKSISIVEFSYVSEAGKNTFDTLTNHYNYLYQSYQGIPGIVTTATPETSKYQYQQEITYDDIDENVLNKNGLQALNPSKNSTITDINTTYTNEGYTCTQH